MTTAAAQPVQAEIPDANPAGNKPPPRPTITDEMIREVAKEIAAELHVEGDEAIEDLVSVFEPYRDGYDIAKRLDDDCCWTISSHMVDTLDSFGMRVADVHSKACLEWVRAFQIQPPLPTGTRIKQGVIEGVAGNHAPASFLVKEDGCTQKGRHLLIRFEDAVPV